MSKIDVIMPTYNQAYFLESAVPAILNQEFTDFTLIIVNDGSKDNTEEELKKYESDSRVKVISYEKNKGLPSALNIGHSNGNSPYCTWVSTDNMSYKNHLKCLYECIENNDYDFVQGRWLAKFPTETHYQDIRMCTVNWGLANLGPCFLYKKKVWETNKYDENMLCAEDLKFYLQAFTHPFKFGYVEEYLLEYYIQPNSLTTRGNPNRRHKDMLNEIYETVIKPYEKRNKK